MAGGHQFKRVSKMKLTIYSPNTLAYFRPGFVFWMSPTVEFNHPKGTFFHRSRALTEDPARRALMEQKLERYSAMNIVFRGFYWWFNIDNYRANAFEYAAYCSYHLFEQAIAAMDDDSWHKSYAKTLGHMTISEERAQAIITDKLEGCVSLKLYKRFLPTLMDKLHIFLPHDYRQSENTHVDYDAYLNLKAEKDLSKIAKERRVVPFERLPEELKEQDESPQNLDRWISQLESDRLYKKASLAYHPDKSTCPREIFQAFSAAYRELKESGFTSASEQEELQRQQNLSPLLKRYVTYHTKDRYILELYRQDEQELDPPAADVAAREAAREAEIAKSKAREAEIAKSKAKEAENQQFKEWADQARVHLAQQEKELEQLKIELEWRLLKRMWERDKWHWEQAEDDRRRAIENKRPMKPSTIALEKDYARRGLPWPNEWDWLFYERDFEGFVNKWWPKRREDYRKTYGVYDQKATIIQRFFKPVSSKEADEQEQEAEATPPSPSHI